MSHVDPDMLALLALGERVEADEQAHIEACADCRRVLQHLCETASLARSLSASERELPAPPARVWDALATELAASGDLPSGGVPPAASGSAAEVRPLPLDRGNRPGMWMAVAAGVVVLALVAAAALLVTREPEPTVVADVTLDPLTEVEPATARLLEGPEGLRLEVETAGLPDPDGYYEPWLIDTEVSRLISLGPLTEGRRYELPPGLDVAAFPVVDVSLEPFDGDPAHSGNSVLRGVLPLDAGGQG